MIDYLIYGCLSPRAMTFDCHYKSMNSWQWWFGDT